MIKAGIIGTGNIGCDLLLKMLKCNFIQLSIFSGRNKDSEGIKLAKKHNINTSDEGIDFFVKNKNYCDIVFDCTNAFSAIVNNEILKEQGIKVIDLTPSRIGELCVPIINGNILKDTTNINMITCGGQASIPILNLISNIYPDIEYIEVVSQIASKSAGIATRLNIDEYVETTESAIKKFTNCKKAKVILNLNPAEPCVNMQTTMFLKINSEIIDINYITKLLDFRIQKLKKIIPGYELTLKPMLNKENILILGIKVIGTGDYLPAYAGNLDIITCASIEAAKYIDSNQTIYDKVEDIYE
jgi:acetaldehyde dehydrogenase